MTHQWVDVAAGAILSSDGNAVLLAKRGANQHQGNLWEFPGGKLEAGERACQALKRELNEELGITAENVENLIVVEHDYGDKAVRLTVFIVHSFTGVPEGREEVVEWVGIEDLQHYAFPEANKPIVSALVARLM